MLFPSVSGKRKTRWLAAGCLAVAALAGIAGPYRAAALTAMAAVAAGAAGLYRHADRLTPASAGRESVLASLMRLMAMLFVMADCAAVCVWAWEGTEL